MIQSLVFFLLQLIFPSEKAPNVRSLQINPCELKGTVFIERNRISADYKVFLLEQEDFADMLVYKVASPKRAKRKGHWYFSKVKPEADFSICVVSRLEEADFSLAYTAFRDYAGCP